MMPNLDGTSPAAAYASNPSSRTRTFCFSHQEEFSEVAAFEAGADDFIKPIKPWALLGRLAAVKRCDQDPTLL
jgi:two-component system alkaline phosphatase synthesis response regulator PhoP